MLGRIAPSGALGLVITAALASQGCATAAGGGTGGAGGSGSTSSATTASIASSVSVTASASSNASSSVSVSSAASTSSTGSGMNNCGNGVIDPGETCDGTDFGGKTCATFGFAGGSLVCNSFCGIVVSSCTPAENCTNGQDDDSDGFVDCDDSDCASNVACTDSCAMPKSVASVPYFDFGDMTGRPNTLTSSCMPQAGRETVYAVVAASTGDISVQVQFANFDAGIAVRTACGDAASEIACVNQNGSGATEALSFPATIGQTYYVIVEAVDNQPGFFDLSIDQVLPESSCTDYVDNDFDGYLDCDDATMCKGTADCTPGAVAVGQPCSFNNQCASAVGGDPICLPSSKGFTNGYCSEFCNLAANDCPGTDECVQLGLSKNGVCMQSCTGVADCAQGYACVDRGLARKVCDRPPEVNCNDYHDNDMDLLVDCEDPTSCTVSPSCVPGTGVAGTPCQLHSDCVANQNDPYCIDATTNGWPGGYCSQFCNLMSPDCPVGEACSSWLSFQSGHGLCLKTCTGPNDCRVGYSCSNDGVQNVCVF